MGYTRILMIPGSLNAQFVHVNWFVPCEITPPDMGMGLISWVLRWWYEAEGVCRSFWWNISSGVSLKNSMVRTIVPVKFGIIYEPFLIHTA